MDHRDRFQAHPLPSRRAELIVFLLCLALILFGAVALAQMAWGAVGQ